MAQRVAQVAVELTALSLNGWCDVRQVVFEAMKAVLPQVEQESETGRSIVWRVVQLVETEWADMIRCSAGVDNARVWTATDKAITMFVLGGSLARPLDPVLRKVASSVRAGVSREELLVYLEATGLTPKSAVYNLSNAAAAWRSLGILTSFQVIQDRNGSRRRTTVFILSRYAPSRETRAILVHEDTLLATASTVVRPLPPAQTVYDTRDLPQPTTLCAAPAAAAELWPGAPLGMVLLRLLRNSSAGVLEVDLTRVLGMATTKLLLTRVVENLHRDSHSTVTVSRVPVGRKPRTVYFLNEEQVSVRTASPDVVDAVLQGATGDVVAQVGKAATSFVVRMDGRERMYHIEPPFVPMLADASLLGPAVNIGQTLMDRIAKETIVDLREIARLVFASLADVVRVARFYVYSQHVRLRLVRVMTPQTGKLEKDATLGLAEIYVATAVEVDVAAREHSLALCSLIQHHCEDVAVSNGVPVVEEQRYQVGPESQATRRSINWQARMLHRMLRCAEATERVVHVPDIIVETMTVGDFLRIFAPSASDSKWDTDAKLSDLDAEVLAKLFATNGAMWTVSRVLDRLYLLGMITRPRSGEDAQKALAEAEHVRAISPVSLCARASFSDESVPAAAVVTSNELIVLDLSTGAAIDDAWDVLCWRSLRRNFMRLIRGEETVAASEPDVFRGRIGNVLFFSSTWIPTRVAWRVSARKALSRAGRALPEYEKLVGSWRAIDPEGLPLPEYHMLDACFDVAAAGRPAVLSADTLEPIVGEMRALVDKFRRENAFPPVICLMCTFNERAFDLRKAAKDKERRKGKGKGRRAKSKPAKSRAKGKGKGRAPRVRKRRANSEASESSSGASESESFDERLLESDSDGDDAAAERARARKHRRTVYQRPGTGATRQRACDWQGTDYLAIGHEFGPRGKAVQVFAATEASKAQIGDMLVRPTVEQGIVPSMDDFLASCRATLMSVSHVRREWVHQFRRLAPAEARECKKRRPWLFEFKLTKTHKRKSKRGKVDRTEVPGWATGVDALPETIDLSQGSGIDLLPQAGMPVEKVLGLVTRSNRHLAISLSKPERSFREWLRPIVLVAAAADGSASEELQSEAWRETVVNALARLGPSARGPHALAALIARRLETKVAPRLPIEQRHLDAAAVLFRSMASRSVDDELVDAHFSLHSQQSLPVVHQTIHAIQQRQLTVTPVVRTLAEVDEDETDETDVMCDLAAVMRMPGPHPVFPGCELELHTTVATSQSRPRRVSALRVVDLAHAGDDKLDALLSATLAEHLGQDDDAAELRRVIWGDIYWRVYSRPGVPLSRLCVALRAVADQDAVERIVAAMVLARVLKQRLAANEIPQLVFDGEPLIRHDRYLFAEPAAAHAF